MGKRLRLFGLLLAICPAAGAIPLCTDYATITGNPSATSATLQDYINLGGGCTVGNNLFSGFTYNYGLIGSDSVDPNVTAAQVQVMVAGPALSPTFTFSAGWSVSSGYQADLSIDYADCVLNSSSLCSGTPVLPLESSSVSFTGTVEDLRGSPNDYPSNINSTLGFAPSAGPVITLNPSLYPSVCATPNTGCPTNSTTATVTASTPVGPTQQLSVGDFFELDSGGTQIGSSNTASLSQISQTFSQAPEPSTLAAVGLGLLGCSLLAFRKSRRAR